MRTPKRRRPRRDERLAAEATQLSALAEKVSYIVSPEHKDYVTAAGVGKLRSDATACPRGLDFGEVEDWLRSAFAAGDVSAALEGDYPRYAWIRIDSSVYEARLSNSVLGEYKGYPIDEDEAPRWLV